MSTAPSRTHPQRVIACVVSRGDLLLLAQRPANKRHGGLWEFPGGKTEENESDGHAAARELMEELGVETIRASPAIFEIADAGSPYVIAFVPVEIRGEPVATEHSSLIWGRPSELIRLPLAPSDAAFLEWLLNDRTSADG
jgi:8-oxo-dGTP pyrophosphatase MutT (NUDIX family)